MEAGKLRHRITFQTRSTSQDAYGELVPVWTDFTTVWASIAPISGRELLAAQATQNESRFTITTRFFPWFDTVTAPAMRIVFGTRIFNILDADNIDERNRELRFSCSEGLSQG